MEEAKQNIKQKKDSYNLRIVTAVLVLTVLVLGELSVQLCGIDCTYSCSTG